MGDDRGSAGRGFAQLLGLVAALGLVLAMMFWPYIVVWLNDMGLML